MVGRRESPEATAKSPVSPSFVWQYVHIDSNATRSAKAPLVRARSGSVTEAAALIGLAALLATATQILLLTQQRPPAPWVACLIPVVALIYVVTGLVAWLRRPSSRLGILMIGGGGAWFLAGMLNLNVPSLSAIGAISQALPLAVIVHLLLGFPTGRLHGAPERITVASGYVVCLALQAPQYLFAAGGPLAIADRSDLVEAGMNLQRMAGAIVVLAVAVLIWRRMRTMSPERRRVLAPLTVYGIFALAMMPVSRLLADALGNRGGLTLPAVQFAILSLVPVGFLVAVSRGGFARSGELAELRFWLGAAEASRADLREALATTLGDPSLELLYRLSEDERLVDSQGVVAVPSGTGNQRATIEVELAGRPIGAIVYDAALLDDPDAIRDAGRVVALALDRQRLTVELRASRFRIQAAADEERRRIARDLHDGLQARLVFLAVQAGTGSPPATIRAGIESAIDELRELVEGVMPVQLAERGLQAALNDLADRLPVPVILRVESLDGRVAPEIETAAFFLISEAVLNAVKHARPGHLEVLVDHRDGHLRIEVEDDGDGGITTGRGRGRRDMADRVEALGGSLVVGDRPEGGTMVQAMIPCE